MNNYRRWIQRWAGAVLVAAALAGWVYRGSPSWMEIIVALIGIGALGAGFSAPAPAAISGE